ncbi:Peptidyl-prolyl cis-trans isomerase CWC27 like protein [Eufriesea mexicana]|nr:Peptidyl-prolyl cis-trans isomerase CWC27 like protein [Eufriesea mexicana]OAD56489.1 Peptidyl-prolyl cis-trans isomerase CWC27 like protein [Eufriesea mexicana]
MKAVRRGNDLTDTGEGGKSIYEEPFNDEFHTRLRFCGRDLIAIANAGKDDNDSQFFFTLGSTPELQNKHRIFGRVTGESIYSMFKLEEALVDENDKPLYPPRLIKTIILNNPFSDIIPRIIGTGNGKGKSTHDHLTDPKLSSQPAVKPPGLANKKRKEDHSSDWKSDDEVETQEELEVADQEKEAMKKRIKNTLRDTEKESKKVQNYKIDDVEDDKGIKENE